MSVSDQKPILIVVAGPTASGKTACAVALASRIDGEVISADSMQVYRGMPVLSACPGPDEMKGVRHHLLGFVDPEDRYTADAYRADAARCIAQVLSRGHQPVLCGGTGLYINAVTRPMSFSEQSDEAMHAELMAEGETLEGRRRLHAMLGHIDPESAARIHENDVRRVARAIEIYRLTGVTQTEHVRRDRARQGDYREIIFALDWPRTMLHRRIDERVDDMLAHGLVDEVRRLMADDRAHPTAMQAIGYKEIAAALRGEITMDEAVVMMRKATRSLAKRQLTWFRHDERVIWLPAEGRSAASLAEEMCAIVRDRSEEAFP
ncbi:MAG: tRNA (adenosine(37)-N6)-dimethylallyltransferase MiaA [Clostridia bacterium]|nr:tRNA (adenosine(37)-N6)-dimethylallyltransferase MiaA [Clostridia bacterium]